MRDSILLILPNSFILPAKTSSVAKMSSGEGAEGPLVGNESLDSPIDCNNRKGFGLHGVFVCSTFSGTSAETAEVVCGGTAMARRNGFRLFKLGFRLVSTFLITMLSLGEVGLLSGKVFVAMGGLCTLEGVNGSGKGKSPGTLCSLLTIGSSNADSLSKNIVEVKGRGCVVGIGSERSFVSEVC